MWVMKGDQIGIAIVTNGGIIEFHAVDVDGHTASVSVVDPAELRQASWLEIPEARRPTAEVAAELGYEVTP